MQITYNSLHAHALVQSCLLGTLNKPQKCLILVKESVKFNDYVDANKINILSLPVSKIAFLELDL